MRLWDLPLPELIEEWDRLDEGGTNVAAIRALCLEDRYYLLVKACRRHDALHPWVLARCREVEREPDGYLDLWAREHYKSTIITFAGAIQEILRNPEICIGILSHTKANARKFLRQIKLELEQNETLKTAFPDVLWSDPYKESPRWSEDGGITVRRRGNPKEATVEGWGLVDGQPTGAHFPLRIYDDVVVPESVTTPDQVSKTTAAWELSDNLGTADGRTWHVGTRYSFADTYHVILHEKRALRSRLHPATDNGREDGKPVLLTPKQWAEKKIKQGPAVIACQMLQNPIAGQQAMFRVRDLQRWEVRPGTLNVYITIDPARSMKRGSANTAMAVIGVDAGRNKYLLDGYNHRMDLKGRWEALKRLRAHWLNQPGVQAVHVGYEAYGAQADLDYFRERMEVERDSFPIVELAWPRDSEVAKDDRVQRLGPDFRSHKFYLPALMSVRGELRWWDFGESGDEIRYRDFTAPSAIQRRVTQEGNPYRVCKPILRADSEGNSYDLARMFVEQAALYPFAPLKDLMDAASRIYDMDPRPPVVIDEAETLPEAFADGT